MPTSLNQFWLQFASRHDLPILSTDKPTRALQTKRPNRLITLGFGIVFSVTCYSGAQVSITNSSAGWKATNGNISIELGRSSGTVQLISLRRVGGTELAITGSPLISVPDKSSRDYRFLDAAVVNARRNGQQLTLRFKSSSGGIFSLMLTLYPTSTVIEMKAKIENTGQISLLLDSHIDPLSLTLKDPSSDLKAYSSVRGEFGFQSVGGVSSGRDFPDWLVLRNESS